VDTYKTLYAIHNRIKGVYLSENGQNVSIEPVEVPEVPEKPEREIVRSLSLTIKLRDDVDFAEALGAVENLGELQNLSIYQQQQYVDGPAFY
jgi:hypothetical protein